MASTNGGRRGGPIWSKPHPHQSLNHAKISVSDHHGPPVPPPRQPLQMANRITTLYDILPLLSNDKEVNKEVEGEEKKVYKLFTSYCKNDQSWSPNSS